MTRRSAIFITAAFLIFLTGLRPALAMDVPTASGGLAPEVSQGNLGLVWSFKRDIYTDIAERLCREISRRHNWTCKENVIETSENLSSEIVILAGKYPKGQFWYYEQERQQLLINLQKFFHKYGRLPDPSNWLAGFHIGGWLKYERALYSRGLPYSYELDRMFPEWNKGIQADSLAFEVRLGIAKRDLIYTFVFLETDTLQTMVESLEKIIQQSHS